MGKINSRAKGASGERELALKLQELFGWEARRTQQFCGNAGDSDVVVNHLPSLFLECKRVQTLNVHVAMDKAVEQANGLYPVMFHRKNNQPWLATMQLDQLMEIAKYLTENQPR
jgi:Holliday junction resolvase